MSNRDSTSPDTYSEYADRVAYEPTERLHSWLARRVLNEFVSIAGLTPDRTSLLEFGTGTGRGAMAASALGFKDYVGVEPNPKLASVARSRSGRVVVEAALPDLDPSLEGKFGAVYSYHVLEHAPDPYAARAWLAAMSRALAPNGSLLVAAPNALDYGAHFWDSDWSHGYPTTPLRVRQLMIDLDLEVLYSGTMHLGRTSRSAAVAAHASSLLVPTRAVDAMSMKKVGRPLGSGLKIALLWGLTFVVARRAT